ncbi:TRAP transporter substrate-binding protein [Arenibacter sp. ARW7G5Y1]|uniref:TRAP transporter substrate-binding protein n=1 Tax=Arenibacter sp. ARW7G5Y1 TaxID=2135619 RepID=UPI000D756455|nr:TRAP transporter substrate-binding protein [Arenibacter sp. ARW7G5Y1]PXX21658.1 tripartite ATP-independent transporter DctP family solute receptor [Arenibacter sp. ARW7G5Y1]
MKNGHKHIKILILSIVCLTIGCKNFQKEPPNEFKLAYVMSPGGLAHKGALKFAELVKQRTNGEITVSLYPSGQLGGDRVLSEGLLLGSTDGILSGPSMIGWYAPQYSLIEAPFVFRDYDHLDKVMNGDIGTEISKSIEENFGINLVAQWYRGPRYLTTTNRKIYSPSDLDGIKLRVPELPTYIKSWKNFGANVTPVPYSDMFMALKLGVVEGQENPLEVIYTSNLYEVQEFVMETQHLISFYLFAVGPRFSKKYPPKIVKIIEGCAIDAGQYQNDLVVKYESVYRDKLIKKGMKFIPVDKNAFRELATKELPRQFKGKWKDGLYQRIGTIK